MVNFSVKHFYGISDFGENIQDEWIIVAFLFELTKSITGLVARIVDSDGEFLLIEAADHLPKWANPDTCENKVYIYNGSVHLVQNSPSNNENEITVSDALIKLRKNSKLYKVSTDVEKCILERIENYPKNISDDMHKAIVYVPIGVAVLLKNKPLLIAQAIRAFCERDLKDLKACRAMKYFPPENRVYTQILISKCLYAMLVHNNFTPDRRTGWNLPLQSDKKYKSHILGIKISCGFEILASQNDDNLDMDKKWLKYHQNLLNTGYYQNLLEGSKDYNKLLENAQEFYIKNCKNSNSRGKEILSLLKSNTGNTDDFKEFNSDSSCLENDDSWLNISSEDLNKMLNSRYGVNVFYSGEKITDSSSLTAEITNFLGKTSAIDGVETFESSNTLEKTVSKTKLKETVEVLNGGDIENNSKRKGDVDFNADAFQSHVQNLLDLIIPEDNWDSNSEMSDYEDEASDEQINGMGNEKSGFQKYVDQMDAELAKTTIGESFEVNSNAETSFDDVESFKPVNINRNTLKNIAESYQSQLGEPGPTSALLHSIGVGINLEKTSEL